jgi:hypothetical protein
MEFLLLRVSEIAKCFQRVPRASAQLREESSVIEEISPEDLGYAENEMTVRYGLEHFFTEPFPELHYSLLMAGRAEVAALA